MLPHHVLFFGFSSQTVYPSLPGSLTLASDYYTVLLDSQLQPSAALPPLILSIETWVFQQLATVVSEVRTVSRLNFSVLHCTKPLDGFRCII